MSDVHRKRKKKKESKHEKYYKAEKQTKLLVPGLEPILVCLLLFLKKTSRNLIYSTAQ